MKKLLLLSFVFTAFSSQAQFWTQKASGFTTPSRGINAISIVDANVVWAKAYDGTATQAPNVREFTKSVNGGNTFTTGIINPLGIGANTAIGSITAVSATTAWVSVNPSANGGNNGIYKTVDGGTIWSKQATAAFTADSFSNWVYFSDANNGVCMGDPTLGYMEIYTTSNGGTTWTRVPQANIAPLSPANDEFGYTNNYVVAGNTIWFGTSSGRLYRSTNMGMNWTASQTPVSDIGGTAGGSYTFSDNNKGLFIATDGSLYNTTNGGTTWTPLSYVNTVYVGDITYIPGTSKVVSTAVDGASVSGSGSSYSLDDGATWSVATTDTGAQLNTVRFLDSSTGYAGGFSTSAAVGGIFKYTGTELPVTQFNRGQFSASPNPTNGFLQLVDSNSPIVDVVVVDLLGKQVYKNKFSDLSEVNLDLTSLQSGAYILKATNNAGATSTLKIMKN